MNADWMTSQNARRVLQHVDDTRPAWLWSQDGQSLLWHNGAAELFLAKLKKHGLKRAPMATPIRGQVSRTIRLGSAGRTSLARIQFLAGEKPASATCATTPLAWEDEQMALLIVAVDAIDADILEAARLDGGDDAAKASASGGDAEEADWSADDVAETRPEGAPEAEPYRAEASDSEKALADWREAESQAGATPQPQPIEAEDPDTGSDRLSKLFDRLAEDEALYEPLTAEDDRPFEAPEEPAAPMATLYRVTGRGFRAAAREGAPPASGGDASVEAQIQHMEAALAELSPASVADPEAVERTSRYNFDELARILNDRIGEASVPSVPAPVPAAPQSGGELVSLGGETLVLNRLPLGILVFRDQNILFANRAITSMVGYDSVESLRQAGLGAVFPAAGPESQGAGPVNHLVQRDGTLVPVTARLQSISWQGRPALMLSASTTEVRTGHEAAVRAFAQTFAELRGDGYIETTRAGVVSAVSARVAEYLGTGTAMLEGKPLTALATPGETVALRDFLERPARFAETARPALTVRSANGQADISLFAQGQAGVVTGYFGFVHRRDDQALRLGGGNDIDPALLARVSRGVRRPLNTIIGFSDLIRSEAFGALGNERYEGYARDIAAAGQEIAALVDELDDYARLRDGRYLPQRARIDLTDLLENCVLRIRQQASGARVFVRNAISESLPKVTGDRASLAQAVLNLMASAIDQTPTGGTVVISAQREGDGSISVHVRDSSTGPVDMAERFVVFRDGMGRDGQAMTPIRSSVGLALTRSLLAVNAVELSVDPAGEQGVLFTLSIPADLVAREPVAEAGEDDA